MKKLQILFVTACVAASMGANAQTKENDTTDQYVVVDHDYQMKTLLGGNHTNGFYLGYDIGFGSIDQNEMVETGGRLAWIIDHSFAIGLFGSGFFSASEFDKAIDGHSSDIMLGGGYGGVMFEPILFPKQPVHLSFPMMVGVGGAGYDNYSYNNHTFDYWAGSDADAFMVFKPGVELEFNILKFFRLGLGAQYRYVYGLNLDGFGKNDLNGFSGNVAFKFGKF